MICQNVWNTAKAYLKNIFTAFNANNTKQQVSNQLSILSLYKIREKKTQKTNTKSNSQEETIT